MSPTVRAATLICAALLAGCSFAQGVTVLPYRLNIQQGNYLDAEDVERVAVGMTRSQVHFLLGTPMVSDPFHKERWDYVFFFKVGRSREEVLNRMTVWFDGDRVVRVERPGDLEEGHAVLESADG